MADRLRPGRGVLAVLGGTGASQVVALLALPVISRLYPPADFGPFAVVQALVIPAATLASLRLELAVPLPQRESDADGLVRTGSMIALTAGLVTLVGTAAVLLVSGAGSSAMLWLFVPVTGALGGLFALLNQLAIRRRRYRSLAVRAVAQAVAVAVGQVGLGLAGVGAWGLATGLVLGQVVGVASLGVMLRRTTEVLDDELPATPWPALLRRYRQFPLVLMPSGLVNAAGLAAPLMLVNAYFGGSAGGWFGLTQRILLVPLALFGAAVAQVFLGEFGHAARSDRSRMLDLFMRSSLQLGALGLVGLVVLALLGPWLFGTVLGGEWERSGQYARWLAPAMAAQLVASPLSQSLVIARRTGALVSWDATRLIVTSATIPAVALAGGGDLLAVGLYSCAVTFSYAALWWLCRRSVAVATLP